VSLILITNTDSDSVLLFHFQIYF